MQMRYVLVCFDEKVCDSAFVTESLVQIRADILTQEITQEPPSASNRNLTELPAYHTSSFLRVPPFRRYKECP
jgi:hypothetical protein